jgi:hypothetical protein
MASLSIAKVPVGEALAQSPNQLYAERDGGPVKWLFNSE